MKGNYQLLKDLLGYLEQYELEGHHSEAGMIHFAGWLTRKVGMAQPDYFVEYRGDMSPEDKAREGEPDSGTILVMLITFLSRYAKIYGKKALDKSPLNSLDEYGFLATLTAMPSLTKSELIQQNLLEFTSGIEIIKRLRKHGLIEEFPDPNDGRSRRVKLTEAGKAMFWDLKGEMELMARIVEADLKEEEKGMLLPVLYRLHQFHYVIHHEDRKSSLLEIDQKYVVRSAE